MATRVSNSACILAHAYCTHSVTDAVFCKSLAEIRHSCEQGDKLASYNWVMHDGRTAGVQHIVDGENNVKFTIDLLKTPGGLEGGSWAARISGEPVDPSSLMSLSVRDTWLQEARLTSWFHLVGRPLRVALITYYGLEGLGTLQMDSHDEDTEEVNAVPCH